MKSGSKLINRILVFILSLSQIVTAALLLVYRPNFFQKDMVTPIISPASYAFMIWGPIIIGCVFYGVYQILPRTYAKEVYDKISIPVMIAFAGFNLWLVAIVLKWLAATVIIIICMSFALYKAFAIIYIAHRSNQFNTFENIVTYWIIGIYFGWIGVAKFVNLAAAGKYYGMTELGASGLLWQGILLMAAVMTALYVLIRNGLSFPYYLTILWALVGIGIRLTAVGNRAIGLVIFAGAIILGLIMAVPVIRLSSRKHKLA